MSNYLSEHKITKLPNGGILAEHSNGDKFWYLNNQNHRDDGPAIEFISGNKMWYINHKIHRIDGPAVECLSGYKEWWINGQQIPCTTQKQFEQLMRLKVFW
jgi:endo-1,4-beta-mannosidase